MRTSSVAITLIVGAILLGGAAAQAQVKSVLTSQGSSTDLAATYTTEQAGVTPSGAGNFWFQGASLDAGFTVHKGFGFAASVTGLHASNIAPGVGLNEFDFFAGPRYTMRFRPKSKHEMRLFGEVMIGAARGFSSEFPKSTGLSTHASSFAYQAGGGLDISVTKRIAIRAFEADYVQSYLPNNGSNSQSRIRLAFGVTYHIQH